MSRQKQEWVPDPVGFKRFGPDNPDLSEDDFAYCPRCRRRRWADHSPDCRTLEDAERNHAGGATC